MTTRVRGGRYEVRGGAVLRGTVRISGAKNHALAAMCAALLTDDDIVLTNVPDLSDTQVLELARRGDLHLCDDVPLLRTEMQYFGIPLHVGGADGVRYQTASALGERDSRTRDE